MQFGTTEMSDTRTSIFTFTLTQMDMVMVNLDAFDRALLVECEASSSIADKLLGLECIARRLEQAALRERGER